MSGPGGQQILLHDDIAAEVERLRSAGLQFRNDGSGNPIELFQPAAL